MLSMTKPQVLRTVTQLVEDLDLGNKKYPEHPFDLTPADEETLHIEWCSTKTSTGESFADFLKKRLNLV